MPFIVRLLGLLLWRANAKMLMLRQAAICAAIALRWGVKSRYISPSFPSEDLTYICFTSVVDSFGENPWGKTAVTWDCLSGMTFASSRELGWGRQQPGLVVVFASVLWLSFLRHWDLNASFNQHEESFPYSSYLLRQITRSDTIFPVKSRKNFVSYPSLICKNILKKYISLICHSISHILFNFSFPPILNQNMDHVNRKMYV